MVIFNSIIMKQENLLNCPLGILYSDGSFSQVSGEGKTPWGIVCCGKGISLKASDVISWDNAQSYCQSIYVGGKPCTCGDNEFWAKIVSQQETLKALNELIISLKGEPLDGRIWTASPYHGDYAWVAFCNQNSGMTYTHKNSYNIKARPVIDYAE